MTELKTAFRLGPAVTNSSTGTTRAGSSRGLGQRFAFGKSGSFPSAGSLARSCIGAGVNCISGNQSSGGWGCLLGFALLLPQALPTSWLCFPSCMGKHFTSPTGMSLPRDPQAAPSVHSLSLSRCPSTRPCKGRCCCGELNANPGHKSWENTLVTGCSQGEVGKVGRVMQGMGKKWRNWKI